MENPKSKRERSSFASLWRDALAHAATFVIHQAPGRDSSRNTSLTVSSALRSAMKMAASFRAETGHPPGTRVAILSEGFGELFPFYHAMWLLGLTVVAIPSNLPANTIAQHLNAVGAQVLVYSPAQMAHLAQIIPQLSHLTHRIVCGELRAKGMIAGTESLSLQALIQSSERIGRLEDYERPCTAGEPPALITFSDGRFNPSVGMEFSMHALLAAAENQSWAYLRDSTRERVASLLPGKHIVSLVHTLFIPLVARIIAFDLTQCNEDSAMCSLADEVIDNQLTAVITDDRSLRDLSKITKTQRVGLAPEFRCILLPSKRMSLQEVLPLKDLIVPCYGLSEAGGIVSVGLKGALPNTGIRSYRGAPLLSAGTPLKGVNVRIFNPSGQGAKGGAPGEIAIQSKQLMSRYSDSTSGRLQLRSDGALRTGDRGVWYFDDEGLNHLVVMGRESRFFRRGDCEVYLPEIEAVLAGVTGVKEAQVIEFPHSISGSELAAFVVLSRHSRGAVNREALMRALLKVYPREVVPKIFMIVDEKQIQILPTREILLKKLTAFSAVDLSKDPFTI